MVVAEVTAVLCLSVLYLLSCSATPMHVCYGTEIDRCLCLAFNLENLYVLHVYGRCSAIDSGIALNHAALTVTRTTNRSFMVECALHSIICVVDSYLNCVL